MDPTSEHRLSADRDVNAQTIHLGLGDMGRRPFTQEQNLHAPLPLLRALDGRVDRVH